MPFSNRIRCLLVDNILNNLSFTAETEIKNLNNLNINDFVQNDARVEQAYQQPYDFSTFKKSHLKAQQGKILKCL